MTKTTIHYYFPKELRYCSPLALVGGIYLLVLGKPIWGALFVLLGIVILTTKYVTQISLIEKKYVDYLFLLWFKVSYSVKSFNSVDKIIITKANLSQKVTPPRGSARTIKWSAYTGTLIFDNDMVDLLTTNNKKELLIELKEFTTFLQVGVEDRTTNPYHWIDANTI